MTELIINEPPITDTIVVGSKASILYNFLADRYGLRYNVITGNIENWKCLINDQPKIIGDRELNTIFIKLSTAHEKEKISKEYLSCFLNSEYMTDFNPFFDFIEKYKSYPRTTDLISKLASCIKTDTIHAEKYIRHWGCGMIASIFGSQSPLTLVLAGEIINTGKTEFFRRLLPKELQQYYDESTLDGGKDDDILMCKKLIIMDDEFGGKSKKDQKHFKGLTSRSKKAIRAVYGRTSTDMRRLCSLSGTTNDMNLLHDPDGNRRILPIHVLDIDKEKYNSIDKISLFMCFYDLYKTGFKWKFTASDIKELQQSSDDFHAINFESELIDANIDIPETDNDGEWMTPTDLKIWIEGKSAQRISNITKFGEEMKRFGFKKKRKKIANTVSRMYFVRKKGEPHPPQMPF